ncbi:MAG: hypothetical protein ACYDBB_09925 [Armatimonadota bacterium]
MNRRQRTMRGVTLIELLMVIASATLISGVIMAMYIASLRVWYRCSSQSQAFPPAYMVITRLNQELKNAYAITVPPNGKSVTFRLPKTDPNNNGCNILPFQLGREISYYCANDTAQEGNTGTVLWRKTFNADTSETSYMRIANNVTNLAFQADASTNGRVFAVYSTTVTVVGKEQKTSHESNFHSTIAIRNPTVQ